MQPIQNILVGLDLTPWPLTSAGLAPIPREAFLRGVELAKLQDARLLLFTALNVSEDTLGYLKDH